MANLILGPALGSAPFARRGAPIVIESQGLTFGAKTLTAAASRPLSYTGSMLTLAKTGGGTAAAEWQVIGRQLAPAQDGGLTNGGTVELVANAGRPDETTFTVTFTTVANRLDVDSFLEVWPGIDGPQFVDAWIAAAADDTIYAVDTGDTQSANADVDILVDRTEIVAGEAVQFDVRFNNGPVNWMWLTTFIPWNFGADEAATFDALPSDSEVRPGRDAQFDYGPATTHVFQTVGTGITASITNGRMIGGRTFSATSPEIDVLDPDTVFAGTKTIVWTTDGDATGAPSGSVHYTSAASGGDENEATIYEAIAAANAVTPRGRLLLKGGQTTTFGEFTPGGNNDRLRGIYVDSFGTGKHTWSSGFTGTTTTPRQILILENNTAGDPPVIRNQILSGRYDAADPQEFDTDATIQFFSDRNTTMHGTFFGIECSGLYGLANLASKSVHSIVNCDVTNWADYGVFVDIDLLNQEVSTGRKRFRGSNIHQKTDVLRRPTDTEMIATYGSTAGVRQLNRGGFLNWAVHGPLRLQTAVGDSVTQCRLESYNGWSSNTADAVADQQALRIASGGGNGAIKQGMRISISGNHIVGGIGEGTESASAFGDVQWSMPLFHIAFNTWKPKLRLSRFFSARAGHFALWNNVADAGSTAFPDPNDGGILFSVNPYTDAQGFPAAFPNPRHIFYSNTVIDPRDPASAFSVVGSENASRLTANVANNLFYAPNASTPFSSLGQPASPDYEVPFGSAAFQGATGSLVAPVDANGNPQRSTDGMSFGTMSIASLGFNQAQAAGETPAFALTAVNMTDAYIPNAIPAATASGTNQVTMAICYRTGTWGGRLIQSPIILNMAGSNRINPIISDSGGTVSNTVNSFSYTLDQHLAILISVDLTSGVIMRVNDVERTNVSLSSANNFNSVTTSFFGLATGGLRCVGDIIGGVWIHYGAALDPATWWDTFFDADNLPKDLGATGVVNGLTPQFYFRNDQTLAQWNAGSNFGSGDDVTPVGTFTSATVPTP